MIKNYILLLIFILFASCSSNAFTLKKKSSADEFLVEKKSPLVLPPSYGKLPLPGNVQSADSENKEETDIQDLLGMQNSNSNSNSNSKKQNNSKNNSIEKSILEKIKKN